jgi:pimeloyl-ACP methyl ester carboxylesterase
LPVAKINEINMYYELHGEGEPIVLIAGLSMDITSMELIISCLSKKYQVLAFDNRGAGRSDKPNIPYTIDMMANDTADLLRALNIAQAHVVGMSMGGRIAMSLALRHPESVKSLVLASTSARPMTDARVLRLKLLMLIPLQRIFKKYPQPYYAFIRQLYASRSFDYGDRLDKIRVPTLILHGKKDKVADRQNEEMHNKIHGSKTITFNGGHRFFFWEYRRFTDTIVEFLNNVNKVA